MDKFDAAAKLAYAEKYKATVMAGVPAVWAMMLNLPNFKDYDLSSVRFCMIGGAMAPKDILARMKEITPYCCNPLGLTETSGLITYSEPGASVENLNQTRIRAMARS
jgi:acyl-CoA synthetase (AMP-forming)/AMP-acid ligase II